MLTCHNIYLPTQNIHYLLRFIVNIGGVKNVQLNVQYFQLKNLNEVLVDVLNENINNTTSDIYLIDKFTTELKIEEYFDFSDIFIKFYNDYLLSSIRQVETQNLSNHNGVVVQPPTTTPIYILFNQWNKNWRNNLIVNLNLNQLKSLQYFIYGYIINKPYLEGILRLNNTINNKGSNEVQNNNFNNKKAMVNLNEQDDSINNDDINNNKITQTNKVVNDNPTYHPKELDVLFSLIDNSLVKTELIRNTLVYLQYYSFEGQKDLETTKLVSPLPQYAPVKYFKSFIYTLIKLDEKDKSKKYEEILYIFKQLLNILKQNKNSLIHNMISYLLLIYSIRLLAFTNKEQLISFLDNILLSVNTQNQILNYVCKQILKLTDESVIPQFTPINIIYKQHKEEFLNNLIQEYKYLKDINPKDFIIKIEEKLPKDFTISHPTIATIENNINNLTKFKLINIDNQQQSSNTYTLFEEFITTPETQLETIYNKIKINQELNKYRNLLVILRNKVLPQLNSETNVNKLKNTFYLYKLIISNLGKETIKLLSHSTILFLLYKLILPYLNKHKKINDYIDYFCTI